MSTSKRGPAYTIDEDLQLCERIAAIYNVGKVGERIRTGMSLQSRFSDLCTPVTKLRGHVRHIEYQNPSGPSDEYIVSIAKPYFVA